MAVLLVFVSTVANCVVPLMKTRSRTLSTLLLIILLAFLWRHWEAISEYLDRFLLHRRWQAWRSLVNSWRYQEFLRLMCTGRTLTQCGELDLNSPCLLFPFSVFSNIQEDLLRGSSLYCVLKRVLENNTTEYKRRKGRDIRYWLAIAVHLWHKHIRVQMHSGRRVWESCTHDFSPLSEFVYTWRTCIVSPTEEFVIQSFIILDLSGIVFNVTTVTWWIFCTEV